VHKGKNIALRLLKHLQSLKNF